MSVSQRKFILASMMVLLQFQPVNSADGAAACTVCIDGSPITKPEKTFVLEGSPINQCDRLDAAAKNLDVTSPLCNAIRMAGTLCGCSIPEGGCTLCHNGDRMTSPDVVVLEYSVRDFLPGLPESNPTCETLEALLHHRSSGTDFCSEAQARTYEQCGCEKPIGNIFTIDSNRSSTPATQNAPTVAPAETCTVCRDGADMLYPDKIMNLGPNIRTCRDAGAIANLALLDSPECRGLQAISSFCGCEAVMHQCTFCANGERVPYPNKKLNWFSEVILKIPPSYEILKDSLTCELYEAILLNTQEKGLGLNADLLCLAGQFKSGVCGCDHDWRPILLTWCYRVSGIFSLIGSAYILWDILRKPKKRRSTYHQLVMGVSFFDCISSTAYALASAMAPNDTGLYGAVGSQATCQLQGFMIQLGYTSVFYNALLSVFFLLVVNYNWREERFIKYRHYWHAAVSVPGLALAIGGLGYYDAQFAVCYVVPPPLAANWVPLISFYTLPVSFAVCVLVVSISLLCRHVFTKEKASIKWRTRKDWKLSKRVFWQSFWYVLSFMLTMPLLLASYFLDVESYNYYWLFLIAGFLAPLQGFLNLFVYLHRDSRVKLSCPCFQTCRGTLSLQESSLESYPSKDPPQQSPLDDQQASIYRANSPTIEPKNSSTVDVSFSQRGTASPVASQHSCINDEDSSDKCAGVREFWKLNHDLNEDEPREGNSTVEPKLSIKRERVSSGLSPSHSKGVAEEGMEDVDESDLPMRELTRIDTDGLFNTLMLRLKKSISLSRGSDQAKAEKSNEAHLSRSYHGTTEFYHRKSGDHYHDEDQINQDNQLSPNSSKW